MVLLRSRQDEEYKPIDPGPKWPVEKPPELPTFDVGKSVDLMLNYCKDARWDIVHRAMESLHKEMEKKILEPGFEWFKADELAIAWADMTYLIAGLIFIIGTLMRRSWSIIFGLYTNAAWSFILLLVLIRWQILETNGFDVISPDQKLTYYPYAAIYVLFGWFGMYYLWRNRKIYD